MLLALALTAAPTAAQVAEPLAVPVTDPVTDRVAAPVSAPASDRGASGVADTPSVLSLDAAVERALTHNRGLGATRARAEAARAGAEAAGAFRWPGVRADAGWTRSDDPVAAFGTRLRQGVFTEADFALDALNDPDAVTDWTAGLGASWTGLDPVAWTERLAATARADAAEAGADRHADVVAFRARILWYDALRGRARLDAAGTAVDAARATRDLLARRRDEGLLTDADVLRGEALLADAEARRVDADREVADAVARLALHLGLPEDADLELPATGEALPDLPGPSDALPDTRADVRAAEAGLEAARATSRSATAARLPALELFAGVSSHAPDAFDGREASTTVGVRLSVPVFTGGALGARKEAAEAAARAAELELRDAEARVRLEVAAARRAVEAARRGREAAAAAAEAAAEARRLVRRRFEEGLATTADLLQAESEAARLRTAAVDAAVRVGMARAGLLLALGSDGSTDVDTNGIDR